MDIKKSIIDLMNFEYETSANYPWGTTPNGITDKMLNEIVDACMGSDDTDDIFEAITLVCGYVA